MPARSGRGKGKGRASKRKANVEIEEVEGQGNMQCSESSTIDVSPSTSYVLAGSMSPPRTEISCLQSEVSGQNSTPPCYQSNIEPEFSDVEVESALTAHQTDTSMSKSQANKGGEDTGKGVTLKDHKATDVQYSFTEEEEREIARWIESNRLLYDMKDKKYKDKALRRQLWEGKAAEYGLTYEHVQKWYRTQRTRFSRLREGQPIRHSQKRSGDGLSSGDEEDSFLAKEAGENDSDRDRFIRLTFGFLKSHIKRQKKDTPASFKDKLALAETGELPLSDDSTMTGSLHEKPHQHKKYTGFASSKHPSQKKATGVCPDSPAFEMRVGASHDLQDRLVDFITREQQVSRVAPFCRYLEAELERLHDACIEPAYDEITTVLNHYRKVSRQLRMREAAGEPISPLQDVPSVFPAQQLQQQRVVTAGPVSTSASFSRVNQLQQGSTLPKSTFYCASKASPSPVAEFQPAPKQWPPLNPPPGSVWRSQECNYMDQTNQQYNLEQQKQYHTLMPCITSTQSYAPSPQPSSFYQLHSYQHRGSPTPQQSTQSSPPAVQQPQDEDIGPLD